jgi:type IV pilus assembly protein PilA
MFCSGCGNNLSADDQFCRVCGKGVSTVPGVAPSFEPVVSPDAAQTSGKAVASLIFGLFLFAFPFSLVAIILGHLSLSEIRKSAGRVKGEGMAMAGLVLGYVGLAAIPVILIIAAIAIPNLLRARMAANESMAAVSTRTLVVAEAGYSSSHPNLGYTCTLSDLAADGLIDSNLASGQKNGYVFELTDCMPSVEGGPNAKFRVVAYPMTPNATGTRAYCSDESGMVKSDEKGSRQDCIESGSSVW